MGNPNVSNADLFECPNGLFHLFFFFGKQMGPPDDSVNGFFSGDFLRVPDGIDDSAVRTSQYDQQSFFRFADQGKIVGEFIVLEGVPDFDIKMGFDGFKVRFSRDLSCGYNVFRKSIPNLSAFLTAANPPPVSNKMLIPSVSTNMLHPHSATKPELPEVFSQRVLNFTAICNFSFA